MFNIIKNVIDSKNFKLENILDKITEMYLEDRISKEQKIELNNLARENAKAEKSFDLQKQVDELRERIEALENKEVVEGPAEPTEPVEEYPLFKKPTGAHDVYNVGDKVIYNGKKYTCIFDNCAWSPDTYPQGWEEVVEATENA